MKNNPLDRSARTALQPGDATGGGLSCLAGGAGVLPSCLPHPLTKKVEEELDPLFSCLGVSAVLSYPFPLPCPSRRWFRLPWSRAGVHSLRRSSCWLPCECGFGCNFRWLLFSCILTSCGKPYPCARTRAVLHFVVRTFLESRSLLSSPLCPTRRTGLRTRTHPRFSQLRQLRNTPSSLSFSSSFRLWPCPVFLEPPSVGTERFYHLKKRLP